MRRRRIYVTGPLYSDTGDPDAIRRAARAAADALELGHLDAIFIA